jgi:HK97 family phage portal protein
MKSAQGVLFTGTKGVRLEDLPEEAWRIVVGGEGKDTAATLYGAVAWLYRCVDIRAGAVANMPWEIRRGETVIMTNEDDAPDEFAWLDDLPGLLYRTEAAVALAGQAYWFRERNLMRTLSVRWMRPDSVKPVLDGDEGLRGFKRTIDGVDRPFEVDDFVYFWLPDPYVELGPAQHYPGKAARNAAGVLANMDAFLAGYFDRGMIKATLLKYKDDLNSKEEKDSVKEWWQRIFTGVKNAFATEVVRGDFDTLTIGEGVSELQNSALTAEQREAICTAMGVPQSKVTANAANYATKQGDDLSFIQDTIAPECKWIAAVVNRQLLGPMGLRLAFKPDELPVMQEDETQRANSLKLLVDAGMSLEMALAVLGYDLPEGIELREPAAATPPQLMPFTGQPQPVPAGPEDGERIEETRRFMRWARKRANPDPDQFESVILSTAEKRALLGLEDAAGADAPFRDWSDESYP